MAAEPHALSFQSFANFVEVVYLAVVGNPVAGLTILHRLMAKRRKIKNGEPAVAEADFESLRGRLPKDHRAGIIRSAVRVRTRRASEQSGCKRRLPRYNAENSPHEYLPDEPDRSWW